MARSSSSHRISNHHNNNNNPTAKPKVNSRQNTPKQKTVKVVISVIGATLITLVWLGWSGNLWDMTEPLSRHEFENAFGPFKHEFESFPYFAYLFMKGGPPSNARLVQIPECLVALMHYGTGLIYRDCAKFLREYQKFE